MSAGKSVLAKEGWQMNAPSVAASLALLWYSSEMLMSHGVIPAQFCLWAANLHSLLAQHARSPMS